MLGVEVFALRFHDSRWQEKCEYTRPRQESDRGWKGPFFKRVGTESVFSPSSK